MANRCAGAELVALAGLDRSCQLSKARAFLPSTVSPRLIPSPSCLHFARFTSSARHTSLCPSKLSRRHAFCADRS